MDRLCAFRDTWLPRIQTALEKHVPRADLQPATLHEAMRYAVFAGGKRVRPLLVLMGAQLAGGNPETALPAACALECMHTYSLIHDDLPAMDNDDMRRGKLTCHKAFDEATAILAGDALQALAFRILARDYPPDRAAPAVAVLAAAVGSTGMAGGQMLDLEAEGKPVDEKMLEAIHRSKTGALLAAAVEIGCIVGGGDAVCREAASTYGHALGLCFQIVDDLLDEQATAEELGKTPGKDREAGKATYPALHGTDTARTMAADAALAAKNAVKSFGSEALMLRLFVDLMLERTS